MKATKEKIKHILVVIITALAGDSVFIGQVRHYLSILSGALISHRLTSVEQAGQLSTVLELVLLSPDFWVGIVLGLWSMAGSWADKIRRQFEEEVEEEIQEVSVRVDPQIVVEEKLSGVSERSEGSQSEPGSDPNGKPGR